MRYVNATVAWIYDFLAEDTILLFGAIVAILITAGIVHATHTAIAPGVILAVAVVIVLAASLWRTVSAS